MEIHNCKVDSFTFDHVKDTSSDNIQLTKNKVLSIIATKTKSSWSDISKKPQLQYLFNYLSSSQVGAVTVVTEYNYIDKHHLEDYSKYYSKCFHQHGRECARIHFFSNEFDEIFLNEAIEDDTSVNKNELQKYYLGYCVIRPIPDSYLGRLCLSPYKKIISDKHKVITQKECVTLFGLELYIETASMREQDKVVAACATSVIWTVLNLSKLISDQQVPSLSQITDIATGKSTSQGETYTNSGLTADEVITVIKHFRLEALEVPLEGVTGYTPEICKNTLSRWTNAYVSQDIPLIFSGEVYKKDKKQGDHFVCIVGYRKEGEKIPLDTKKTSIKINFEANLIDRLYVHDDRYGQYVAIKLDEPREVICNDDHNTKLIGYPISNENNSSDEEIFVPADMIISLDNKIRLNFSEVETVAYSLFKHIESGIESELIAHTDGVADEYQSFIDGFLKTTVWNIELVSNRRFKRELRKKENFYDSSFGLQKSEILIKNLPKHLWRITIKNEQGEHLSDLIFDATEVFQQNIMISYINYDRNISYFWKNIEALVQTGEWQRITKEIKKVSPEYAYASVCITSKLINPIKYLDADFGLLRHPSRDLHDGELDSLCIDLSSRPQNELFTIVNEFSQNWPKLDPKVENGYIWVIDEHGHLVCGQDIDNDSIKNGHATLIGFKPARCGGELKYDPKEKAWCINTSSGAYSKHLRNPSDQKVLLETLLNKRFSGFKSNIIFCESNWFSKKENGNIEKKPDFLVEYKLNESSKEFEVLKVVRQSKFDSALFTK